MRTSNSCKFRVHFAKVSVHKIFRFHAQREQATSISRTLHENIRPLAVPRRYASILLPALLSECFLGFALGNGHVNLRISSVRKYSRVFARDIKFASGLPLSMDILPIQYVTASGWDMSVHDIIFCKHIAFESAYSISLPSDGSCPRALPVRAYSISLPANGTCLCMILL